MKYCTAQFSMYISGAQRSYHGQEISGVKFSFLCKEISLSCMEIKKSMYEISCMRFHAIFFSCKEISLSCMEIKISMHEIFMHEISMQFFFHAWNFS